MQHSANQFDTKRLKRAQASSEKRQMLQRFFTQALINIQLLQYLITVPIWHVTQDADVKGSDKIGNM